MRSPKTPEKSVLTTFATSLGWMAMIGSGNTLEALSFGHDTPEAAVAALDPKLVQSAQPGQWNPALVQRLQAYAAGKPDDFRDVEVDFGRLTPFQRRVAECCRKIPPGQTLSYGGLAAKAGSPNAARAVGCCMAANRIPLVIPCHRVVGSSGRLHGFSAAGGLEMKQRLLDLERSATRPVGVKSS